MHFRRIRDVKRPLVNRRTRRQAVSDRESGHHRPKKQQRNAKVSGFHNPRIILRSNYSQMKAPQHSRRNSCASRFVPSSSFSPFFQSRSCRRRNNRPRSSPKQKPFVDPCADAATDADKKACWTEAARRARFFLEADPCENRANQSDEERDNCKMDRAILATGLPRRLLPLNPESLARRSSQRKSRQME